MGCGEKIRDNDRNRDQVVLRCKCRWSKNGNGCESGNESGNENANENARGSDRKGKCAKRNSQQGT